MGCRPSETRRIYIANHTSHADFILLWSALTPRLRSHTFPVAAADYWNANGVRRYMVKEVFRAVLVERDSVHRTHDPVAAMLQALDDGNSLIMFPEGTRGRGEALQPFKCGIFHLASTRPNVELVPVWRPVRESACAKKYGSTTCTEFYLGEQSFPFLCYAR